MEKTMIIMKFVLGIYENREQMRLHWQKKAQPKIHTGQVCVAKESTVSWVV